ncbi:hypothetical protein NP511_14965 [Natrinema thermotolerans]|uniref:Uncharacterized protein n=1 Tax=Natrinema thermotolerans TaxID=121872 RepID=A0AAF0P810_9EURY|nr:hypothetical protein [Natrinema thermotolerans]QCC59699.1 hypothetical protein DVR14_14105 [Natrinema thermotolerans]WMT06682.1 hypothetical protein NP511_14965 [Natrinema thermotolerans]
MSDNPASDTSNNVQAQSGWQSVIEEMAAIADEYRDRGWTALELHPGDAVLVDSEKRTGLDVLLPGPEYENLESLTENCSFVDVDVFRAADSSMFYLLIVEKDPESETVVFVPAYYDPGSGQPKLDTIRSDSEFRLFCRRLSDDYIEFVHGDVQPFLPEALQSDE